MNRQVYGSGIDQVMGADLARSQLNSQELAQAMALMQQSGRMLQQDRQFEQEQKRLGKQHADNIALGMRRIEAQDAINEEYRRADREARALAAKQRTYTSQAQTLLGGLGRGQVDPVAVWNIGKKFAADPDIADIGFSLQQAARGAADQVNAAYEEAMALSNQANQQLSPFKQKSEAASKALTQAEGDVKSGTRGSGWFHDVVDWLPGGDVPMGDLKKQSETASSGVSTQAEAILKTLGDQAGALVFDTKTQSFQPSPVFKRYDMSLFDDQPMPTSGGAAAGGVVGGASDPESMQSGAADQMTFPSTRKPAAPPADQQARDTTAAGGGAPKPPSAPTRARLPDGTIVTIDPAEFQNIVAELVRKGHTAEDAQRIAVSRLLRLAQQGAYNSVLPPSNEPSRTQPPRGYSSGWRPVGSGIPLGF